MLGDVLSSVIDGFIDATEAEEHDATESTTEHGLSSSVVLNDEPA